MENYLTPKSRSRYAEVTADCLCEFKSHSKHNDSSIRVFKSLNPSHMPTVVARNSHVSVRFRLSANFKCPFPTAKATLPCGHELRISEQRSTEGRIVRPKEGLVGESSFTSLGRLKGKACGSRPQDRGSNPLRRPMPL